jgi:hypothetical protein
VNAVKKEPSYSVSAMEIIMKPPQETKIEKAYDPEITLLDIHPKECKSQAIVSIQVMDSA